MPLNYPKIDMSQVRLVYHLKWAIHEFAVTIKVSPLKEPTPNVKRGYPSGPVAIDNRWGH